jgi:hypothetical protein
MQHTSAIDRQKLRNQLKVIEPKKYPHKTAEEEPSEF